MKQYRMFIILLVSVLVVGAVGWLANPAPSRGGPQPKSIVTEVAGSQLQIYVEETEGGPRSLVTAVDRDYVHPLFGTMMSISPDGEQLLYVTVESTALNNAELYLAAMDGSSVERIAAFEKDLWTVAPVWSPDSQNLAVVRQVTSVLEEPGLGLWILDIQSGNLTRVATDKSFTADIFLAKSEGVLRWSNNGDAIQYVDRFDDPPMAFEINLKTGKQSSWEAAAESLGENELSSFDASLPCSVPLFNQNSYGNDLMRTCGSTIKTAGCALTSATMVADYYGVNIDPPTMNRRLGDYACPLDWTVVASRSVTDGRMSVTRARHLFSYGRLEDDLKKGRPPIVWVTKGCSGYTWTHFVVVTGGSGSNPNNYTINDPANGTKRKLSDYTNIGYCLREISTYSGTPACSDDDGGLMTYGKTKSGTISPAGDIDVFYFNGTKGDIVTIKMNKKDSNLNSFLILTDPAGGLVNNDDDRGGDKNARLVETLPDTGLYRIHALGHSTSTGAYTVTLTKEAPSDPDDGRWMALGKTRNGTISPKNDRDVYYFNGSVGTVVSVRMNKRGSSSVDSLLELYNPSGTRIATNNDGGGNRNAWLVRELPTEGTYRIVARSSNSKTSGNYSISLSRVTSGNLALNKGALASSIEFRGGEAYRAFDGNNNTRWSSNFLDPGWIYVDLGSVQTFNKVILRWETAHAKMYAIQYWSGSSWSFIYTTLSGNGGVDTITFNPTSSRYVRMYGYTRGTPWGYSLWEFEVYNTANLLIPLVPPDPPDSDVDIIEPLVPLGPNDGDTEVMLVGEGDDAQEDYPLAGDIGQDPPTDTVGTSIPFAEIVSPSELDGFFTQPGHFRFEGYGIDNDEDGESIVAHSWRSDLDGELSSEQSFTLPFTSLSDGLHTIYYKVQDNEGDWSEEASVPLAVDNRYTLIWMPVIRG